MMFFKTSYARVTKVLNISGSIVEWDNEDRTWSPVELSHCFDKEKVLQAEIKSFTVLQMVDSLIERFLFSYYAGR